MSARQTIKKNLHILQNGLCFLCGNKIKFPGETRADYKASLDHLVPVVHGGGDHLENIRLTHHWCNQVRGSRWIDEELKSDIREGFNAGLIHPYPGDRFYFGKMLGRFVDWLGEQPGFRKWSAE